jgi:GAF domain-containing protein
MYDFDMFTGELSRFARNITSLDDDNRVLADLTESVRRMIGVDGAGVTLMVDGRLTYGTASPEPAAALERCQEQFQAGPCRDAYTRRSPTVLSDVRRHAVRWPAFAAAARRHGMVAVAAIPMQLGGEQIGALDLYIAEPHVWSSPELAAARVMAELATGSVLNAHAQAEQQQLTEQLQQALGTRVVIEQAKGMLADRHRITMIAAFELIRQHARGHHLTVQSVAAEVVARRLSL